MSRILTHPIALWLIASIVLALWLVVMGAALDGSPDAAAKDKGVVSLLKDKG